MGDSNNKPIKLNKFHIQSTTITKAQKGLIAEHQAIIDLTNQGYYVALATNPQSPFDLVAVDEDGNIRLIDVKTTSYRKRFRNKNWDKKSYKIYRSPTAKQKKLNIELMMVDNES
jgi:hypothetical protein